MKVTKAGNKKTVNKKKSHKRGFTLIELLVVISIIALLSSVVLLSVNSTRSRARDAQRRSDLHQIANALELYYNKNGAYPSTATAVPNSGASAYSTQSNWMAPLVTDGELPSSVRDPINIDNGPWCFSGNTRTNTIYTYASDGKHYVLCAWMENGNDPNTLQYADVKSPWNETLSLLTDYSFGNSSIVIAR